MALFDESAGASTVRSNRCAGCLGAASRVLDRLGLVAALEWLVREFDRRSAIRTDLVVSGIESRWTARSRRALRITQEA